MPKRFAQMKAAGEKIAALTAYDATTARLQAQAGVDILLVGDSLGQAIKGEKDTLNVSVEEVAYHTRAVCTGAPEGFVIADMPFASFQQTRARAFANAAKFLAAGANMVKIEGGAEMARTVHFLTQRGVPVCAHIGLLPQAVRASGGYQVQGRGDNAERVKNDARTMQAAGAALIVLELLPQQLAAEISAELTIPTIGIGCGAGCDGQVLVVHDMLGMTARKLRFAKDFLAEGGCIAAAFAAYVKAVKEGTFPAAEHAVD